MTAKVTAQIDAICLYRPFAEGNKRTAPVAADVCLRLDGYRLLPSDKVESFFWSIARGEQQLEDSQAWLKKQVTPLA
ncbi:MAG: hypothetical protein NT140_05665 [Deltaproteobacteria bacterium]|nr:hypothetical protein [Deltaproteobacteria bacterium]